MLMYTAGASNGMQGRVPNRGGVAAAADTHGLPTINWPPSASLEELSSMTMAPKTLSPHPLFKWSMRYLQRAMRKQGEGQRRTYILRLKTDPHFWHLAILRLLIVLVKATGMQAITCPLHLFHAAAVAILPQRWRHHQTRNG